MKNRTFSALQTLFRISLCAALLFGTLLTLGQLAGVLAMRPEWVTGSQQMFFKPAMIATAAFGLLAYLAPYLRQQDATQ